MAGILIQINLFFFIPQSAGHSFPISRQRLVPALPSGPPPPVHFETGPHPAHTVPVQSRTAEQLQRGSDARNAHRGHRGTICYHG